ncbi:class C beta-lactamase-related serine hydrolase [Flavobacteriaceae bacterium AU392]|nr:class C beta-lactamase-related serine hydrolase [Flavobacteriaceae bacterium]RKM84088.1 class C beta-lactamase-related serine hydrolase [Flavobacteriaceae bacterium AU392]
MKKIKLNKTSRRFLRIFGTLFSLWLLWSIYYFFTLTAFSDRKLDPITVEINRTEYKTSITEAKILLKGVTSRLDVPSFSIAIGHNGKVIWSVATGYQDLDLKIPATPKTQYRIGSTSKSVTATGVARAIDKGFISLDAIIGDTISNWTKKRWDFTMRQLLSHTAGIGNYEDFGMKSAKYTLCNCYQFNSASEGLKVFDSYKMLYEPGTSFKYSTFDVNLASVVLEQAVHQPFLEYMNQYVFQPLNMQNTYADHTKPKTEHFATFYDIDNGYYREYRTIGIKHDVNLSYKWAGGGFISTPTDMVKMGNAYLNDSTFINRSTIKEFWMPIKLISGEINEQEYAVGWRSYLNLNDEHLLNGSTIWMVNHGGVSKGSMNFLVLFPNYNLVIDASINARARTFGEFANEVKKIANVFIKHIQKEEFSIYNDMKSL